MPPLKTFTFINKFNPLIQIEIRDYEKISAKWKLERIVKDVRDWEIK